MVDAVRSRPAGSGVSDGPRSMGTPCRWGSCFESSGGESDSISAGAAASIRGLDGSTAVIRKLPNALPGNADGNSRLELLLSEDRTGPWVEFAADRTLIQRSCGGTGAVG